MEFKPHEYQQNAIKHLLQRGAAGLFLDPGLGKTSIVLSAIEILKRKGICRRTLIIAPLRVMYSVWPGEIQKWDMFHEIDYTILHGSNKDRNLQEQHDVYLINPEGLEWLFERLVPPKFDTLVIDESTKFKHNNKRFKIIKKHLAKFYRRWILTGSPAPNGLMDLFYQIYIMDQGHSLGSYISHFRMKYFTQSPWNMYEWKPRPESQAQIVEKISPMVLTMKAEDYIKLPPIIENTIEIDLPEKARQIYDQLESEFIVELEQGLVTAANAASKSIKLMQVANGGLYYNEDGNERRWQQIHNAKNEVLMDLLEELSGQPTLVAYAFLHDLERLRNELGQDVPFLGGGVPPKKAAEIEFQWNCRELPVVLVQPQSVAHGLNLQAGRAVIWYALTWDYELYDQLIRRVYRQGQQERVTVHHIVCKNTIDEVMMRRLRSKANVQNTLIDDLKNYFKK